VICPPGQARDVSAALAGGIEVWEEPIDDSWLRDSGPIVVTREGERHGAQFGFNAWGGKFPPWDDDATIAGRLCDRLGLPWERSQMILEGGAIAVDGTGTLVTTEQCLLNANRNPDWSREEVESELRARLGVERIVWVPHGLVEDRDTDGHIDLIAAFAAPGVIAVLDVPEDNPNAERLATARDVLRAAGLEVLDVPGLVYDSDVAVSPMNLYVCNGAVIMSDQSPDALAAVRAAFHDREVVGVTAETLAYGGGGPHCITQQVPYG